MDYGDIFKDVEPDMAVHVSPNMNGQFGIVKSDIDNYIHEVFLKRPLLGSEIIPEGTVAELDTFIRNCIKTGKGENGVGITLREAEKATVALVTYAKDCNLEKGAFWSDIAKRLGYGKAGRDKVERFFSSCIERIFYNQRGYKRYFIETKKDESGKRDSKQYVQTIALHAFAPKRYWFAILNFLFKFYTRNIRHELDLKDPILDTMFDGLRRRFLSERDTGEIDKVEDAADEGDFLSGAGVNNFHTGVKHLICEREKYAKALLISMLYRIERLVKKEELPGDDYEDLLCREWYAEKIKAITEEIEETKCEPSSPDIVYNRKNIKARFVLDGEDFDKVTISIPDIRCSANGRYRLKIYCGERLGSDDPMHSYGDEEFGRTLEGRDDVPIPPLDSADEFKRLRVVIEGDGETIYDSGEDLYREYMLFRASGGREIDRKSGPVAYGRYILVLPEDARLGLVADGKEPDELFSFNQDFMTGYLAELREGFALSVDGRLVFSDRHRNETSVLLTACRDCPTTYERDGIRYTLIRAGICPVIAKNMEDAEGCDIRINGEKPNLEALKSVDDDDSILICLPVEKDCTLTFVNPKTRKKERYFAVEDVNVNFNREYYYSREDCEDAVCNFRFNGSTKCLSFSCSDLSEPGVICVPHADGVFVISIPAVIVSEDLRTSLLNDDAGAFLHEIPQEKRLFVKAPKGVIVEYVVGNMRRGCVNSSDGPVILAGDELHSFDSDCAYGDWFDASLEITAGGHARTYRRKTIFRNEFFEEKPSVVYDNETRLLSFVGADKFVGRDDTEFIATIFKNNREYYDHVFSRECLCLPLSDQVGDGEYGYRIFTRPKLFQKFCKLECEGKIVVGDKRLLQFRGCVLEIEPIFGEDRFDERVFTNTYSYKVREIEYVARENLNGVESDVYKGILYTETRGDKRTRDFSSVSGFDSETGETRYKVNPVKMRFEEGGRAVIMTADELPLRFDVTKQKKPEGYFVEITDKVRRDKKGGETTVEVTSLYSYRKL